MIHPRLLSAHGARLEVIPSFDGYRLVWPQRDGSLIYLTDEEDRALIFTNMDVAWHMAKSAQKLSEFL